MQCFPIFVTETQRSEEPSSECDISLRFLQDCELKTTLQYEQPQNTMLGLPSWDTQDLGRWALTWPLTSPVLTTLILCYVNWYVWEMLSGMQAFCSPLKCDWSMLICVKHVNQLVEVISVMWIKFKWETSGAETPEELFVWNKRWWGAQCSSNHNTFTNPFLKTVGEGTHAALPKVSKSNFFGPLWTIMQSGNMVFGGWGGVNWCPPPHQRLPSGIHPLVQGIDSDAQKWRKLLI